METNRTPGVTFTSNRRVDDCPKPVPAPVREYRCPLDSINEASAAQAGKSEIIFDRPMGCEIATTDKAGGSVGKDSSSQTNFLDLPRSDIERISALTSNSVLMNSLQCRYMLSKLERTMPELEWKDVSAEDPREAFRTCQASWSGRMSQQSIFARHIVEAGDINVAEFGMSNDFMPYSYDDEHFDTTSWRAVEIRGDRHKSDSYIDSKEERPPNVPSFILAHFRKWRRKHFYLQVETLSKEIQMFRRTAEEHAASLEITDDKSADCHKFFTVNSVLLNQYRYMSSELERKDVTAEAFRSLVEAADIKPLQISPHLCSLFHLNLAHRDLEAVFRLLPSKYTSQHLDYQMVQMVKVADFGVSRDSMPYMFESPHIGTTSWRAPEILVNRHKPDVYNPSVPTLLKADLYSFGAVCYEVLTGRVPFEDVTKVHRSGRSEYEMAVEAEIEVSKFHWSELAEVRHEKLRHGLLKNDGTLRNGRQEESPVSGSYIDSKEERPRNVPSFNLAHSRKWRRKHFYLRDETLSKEIQMLRRTAEEHAAANLEITDDKSAICYKFFTDEPLEEITAESSSCLETNSSRSRKSKRATATVTDDHDLLSKLAPLVKQQIEDALSATLLPLVAVLRSREEKEQKHREQMLALEEQKLALKRQKLALERQNLLLELRRGVKHSRSSHLSGRRQGLKKPRY